MWVGLASLIASQRAPIPIFKDFQTFLVDREGWVFWGRRREITPKKAKRGRMMEKRALREGLSLNFWVFEGLAEGAEI